MNISTRLALVMIVFTLAGCGREARELPAPARPKAAAAKTGRPICERVTAEQMSAILGAPMNPEPKSEYECGYLPKGGGAMPMAELAVEPGSAVAAMTASGMLVKAEPGMVNPYEGMGDQASAIGPAVWVKRGEDLVRITVMGVDDHDAAVRHIYELVDKGF